MLRCLIMVVLFALNAVIAVGAELKVGVSADYPPMAFKQEGRIMGIEADNATAVGSLLGLEMTLVDMPFVKLLPALQAGEIDVIMSGFSITAARKEQVIFTDSYMDIGQMGIVTTEKVGQFSQPWALRRSGVRIGVEPGTTGADYAENELKEGEIKFYADSQAAFTGLRSDEIDVYIHDAPTSWRLAATADNNDLISLYHSLTNEELAWAVRKDDERLAEQLDFALAKLKANGTLGYILNRWIPVTLEVR
ncbi:MAG: ABC transporter substrate-binding protein [Halioglobus sp.]|nr:ABC transporter substrate-binding protein [Halioglobus sp.]